MKILIFNRHYLPGFKAGGPIRSLANMVALLGQHIEFYLVTTDRDLLDKAPYPGISSDTWMTAGLTRVRYLAPSEVSFSKLCQLVAEVDPDTIYLNSFFDPIFSLRMVSLMFSGWLPKRRLLIAPRGEFSPGALALRSFRKSVYVSIFKRLHRRRQIYFHASTSQEALDIVRSLRADESQIKIAPDLCTLVNVSPSWQPRKAGQPLRVCFLSRISPKKNLLGTIRILAAAKTASVLDIYGPEEDRDYWLRCQSAIAHLPSHVKAHHRGVVPYENVAATIGQYDLFLFPTHGENFGHVIIEALGVGVPVIVSDTTPWNDLAQHGAGWAIGGDVADYAARVDEVAERSDAEQLRSREQSAAYADRVLKSELAFQQNAALFDLDDDPPSASDSARQTGSRRDH